MATLNTLHGSTWRTTRVTLRTRGPAAEDPRHGRDEVGRHVDR